MRIIVGILVAVVILLAAALIFMYLRIAELRDEINTVTQDLVKEETNRKEADSYATVHRDKNWEEFCKYTASVKEWTDMLDERSHEMLNMYKELKAQRSGDEQYSKVLTSLNEAWRHIDKLEAPTPCENIENQDIHKNELKKMERSLFFGSPMGPVDKPNDENYVIGDGQNETTL